METPPSFWLCPSPYSLVAGLVSVLPLECPGFLVREGVGISYFRFRGVWNYCSIAFSVVLLFNYSPFHSSARHSFTPPPPPCLLSSHYNEVLHLYGSLMRCGGLDCCFTISVRDDEGAEGNYNSSRGDPPGSALFSLSTLAEFSIFFWDVVLILQRFTNKDFCSVGNYKPEQANNFYFHRTKNRNEREPLSTTYSHMTRRDNGILRPLGDDHPPPSMLRKSLANKTCRNNSLFRFSY